MAVTRVNQGEIVEVPFELPDGSISVSPARRAPYLSPSLSLARRERM